VKMKKSISNNQESLDRTISASIIIDITNFTVLSAPLDTCPYLERRRLGDSTVIKDVKLMPLYYA
tara:strand:- start:999 stop:1193 length:195 start_codon:yes stop_codon:yes gene_type:complete